MRQRPSQRLILHKPYPSARRYLVERQTPRRGWLLWLLPLWFLIALAFGWLLMRCFCYAPPSAFDEGLIGLVALILGRHG